MSRPVTRLSFVILEVVSRVGERGYLLQLNKYLKGYNFLGGHIETETPHEAVVRELKEECGATEIKERWGIDLRKNLTEADWSFLHNRLEEVKGSSSKGSFYLPFRSYRTSGNEGYVEKNAELYFFRLRIEEQDSPRIYEKVKLLADLEVEKPGEFSGEKLFRLFSPKEFFQEAWENSKNPFLRFAVKKQLVSFSEEFLRTLPFLLPREAVELQLEKRLEQVLGEALLLHTEALDISLSLPSADEAAFCLRTNRTLLGSLIIRWSGSKDALRFSFPSPVQGVFLLNSAQSKNGRAGSWIWHPRLVGQPGLWFLRKHEVKEGKQKSGDFLRLVLSARNYFDYSPSTKKKKLPSLPSRIITPYTCPGSSCTNCDGLAEIGEILPSRIIQINKKERNGYAKRLNDKLKDIMNKVETDKMDGGCHPLDEQDLGWQRLYTYSAFLIDQVLGFFATELRDFKEKNALTFWSRVSTLVTEGGEGFQLVASSELIKTGWFHNFDPLNSIDALSRLSSFQRYGYPQKTLEQLPAIFRQNHPSYKGIICPVETPESKKVGITLHLASNVQTDALGLLYPASQDSLDSDLGYASSLVPFYQHNDGPRSMMGAKNLKQAVPIRGRQTAAIQTGKETAIAKLAKPILGLEEKKSSNDNALGTDLLVAYMPWYGWNMEDAIVANKRLVDDGVMDWETEDERSIFILPGYKLTAPVFENTFEEAFKVLQYDSNGLRKPGPISPQNPLAFFKNPTNGQTIPVLYDEKDAGELLDVRYVAPPAPHLGGSMHWKVHKKLPLMVGDKLMGRYGNKGVVSTLLSDEKLPRLPDDPRLPKELRGRTVDLVLNPHGVISRMNLGQLLETSIGLALRLNKSDNQNLETIGQAFKRVDLDPIRKIFHTTNAGEAPEIVNQYGRIFLDLPNGKKTETPVVVGFQHIVRLKHVATQKAHVRGWPNLSRQPAYNLVTGQPVSGKRRGGGQRLGEMEIWALSAHSAKETLQTILQGKSDPSLPGPFPLVHGQTFQAIKDHLCAMGFETKVENGSVTFSWLSPETIVHRMKEVRSAETWGFGVEGHFTCPQEQCGFTYPGRVRGTGQSERSRVVRLTVRDVLREHGLVLPQNTVDEIPLLPVSSGKTQGELHIDLIPVQAETNNRKRKLTFSYKLTKRTILITFKLGRKTFTAYMQSDRGKKKRCLPVTHIADFWLCCNRHKSSHLKCEAPQTVPFALPGGLCDPLIFGGVSVNNWAPEKWGFIRLPDPVAYPDTTVGKSGGPLRFGKMDLPPRLEFIPVLPLKYRYRGHSRAGITEIPEPEELTSLYQELLQLSQQGAPENKLRIVIKQIFEQLHRRLFGKFGLLRRDGLGRRVETSGRMVIVPDPDLPWDSCGVPTETLFPLLRPEISKHPEILLSFVKDDAIDRLIKAAFGEDLSIPDISKEAERFILSEEFWSNNHWPKAELSREHLVLIHKILSRYLEVFPETNLLLNRQPYLHRYSIMGFKPVPLPPGEGMILKINPLVCKGFGADFDGDEMTIHLPWSKEEHAEAERMKPTKPWNLFSWANHEPMANFDQDFVAGHFLLSKDNRSKAALKTLFFENYELRKCEKCRDLLEQNGSWKKGAGEELLKHLCAVHPEISIKVVPEWMRLAFKALTEHGLSFGFLSLHELHKSCSREVDKVMPEEPSGCRGESLEDTTGKIGAVVLEHLQNLVEQNSSFPGYGFAVLAVSGARGTKQTRQLIGARGLLGSGDTGFAARPSDFFVVDNFVTGMTPSSSFMAAMNARSSMVDKKLGTGKAGALTRALVLTGWDWTVKSGNCGSEQTTGNLTGCRWVEQKVVCSNCYGAVSGFAQIPDGFPAGLIAAQSFGERGTQLSMQSFHTSQKQLSIDEMTSLLNGKDRTPFSKEEQKGRLESLQEGSGYNWFEKKSDAPGFVKRIKRESAYRNIDENHLYLIWLAIHLSEKRTNKSAWEGNRSSISGLIGPGQWQSLLESVRLGTIDDLSSPFARVVTGQSPVHFAVRGDQKK